MTLWGVLEAAAGSVLALVAYTAGRRLLALPTWLLIKRRIDEYNDNKARTKDR